MKNLPTPCATFVIPTLQAGPLLTKCLESLTRQTRQDFEVVIVDNSGQRLVHAQALPGKFTTLDATTNSGYGGAINLGAKHSKAPFVIALNDDATLDPTWLETILSSIDSDKKNGMATGAILLADKAVLDSAGMLLCADGSSKQRGHGQPASAFPKTEEILLPSGAAALYRRAMLDEIGGFDESFFLYCEDTDLGLRARWAGWKCIYVPNAVALHHYSSTTGRVSPLKAYYVERNRLFLLFKNFPLSMLIAAPFAAIQRYFWHAAGIFTQSGIASEFHRDGNSPFSLAFIVLRAHLALFKNGWRLMQQRRSIMSAARIPAAEFRQLCHRHSITPRQVAAL